MAEPNSPLDLDLRLKRASLAQNLRSLGARGRFVPPPPAHSPQTVVKGTISSGHTTAQLVQQYLAPHKEKAGRDEPFFGPQGTILDPKPFVERASSDPHQFRFIVSFQGTPPFLPMRGYVEALMARVEKDLGRPLDWLAAVHRDTANLHAHVVLRGKDQKEQPLYILNGYLRTGLRYQAQHTAFLFLGPDKGRARERSREPGPTVLHHAEASGTPAQQTKSGLRYVLIDIGEGAGTPLNGRSYATQAEAKRARAALGNDPERTIWIYGLNAAGHIEDLTAYQRTMRHTGQRVPAATREPQKGMGR